MENKTSPVQVMVTFFGCLVVLATPIVGILLLWGFDPSKLTTELKETANIPTYSDADVNGEYDFVVPAGEDALLTSIIVDSGKQSHVSRRNNPAVMLKIDNASINGPIVYGQDGEEMLRQGFWHYPSSAYLGEKGTSVIFGHRRYHLPPATNTFYNMHLVSKGDRVEIKLEDGTWLEYTVTKIDVIDPEDLHILLAHQDDNFLVKFVTCTPLGTADQRLIVTARKTF